MTRVARLSQRSQRRLPGDGCRTRSHISTGKATVAGQKDSAPDRPMMVPNLRHKGGDHLQPLGHNAGK